MKTTIKGLTIFTLLVAFFAGCGEDYDAKTLANKYFENKTSLTENEKDWLYNYCKRTDKNFDKLRQIDLNEYNRKVYDVIHNKTSEVLNKSAQYIATSGENFNEAELKNITKEADDFSAKIKEENKDLVNVYNICTERFL